MIYIKFHDKIVKTQQNFIISYYATKTIILNKKKY
jgi:hypothetical protein